MEKFSLFGHSKMFYIGPLFRCNKNEWFFLIVADFDPGIQLNKQGNRILSNECLLNAIKYSIWNFLLVTLTFDYLTKIQI